MELTEKHKTILEIIKRNPYCSQKEMANAIGLSRSATANLIIQLVSEGYILGKAYVLNENRNKVIVCIGGANVDQKLHLFEEVQYENSNPVKTSYLVGGVARNIAENLGRLGCPVSLMSLMGDDDEAKQIFQVSGSYMSFDHTELIASENTGKYTAILDTKGDLVVGFSDMTICEKMNRDWIVRHHSLLDTSRFIIVDTNVTQEALVELIRVSNAKRYKLIINNVSAPKAKRVPKDLKGLYGMIMNLDEAKAILETDNNNLKELVQAFFDRGVKNVVITNSIKKIAVGINSEEIQLMDPIVSKKVIDVTGAGDSFCAGLVYGLYQGKNILDAVEYAKTISYLTVQTEDSVRQDLSQSLLEKEMEKLKNEQN